MKRALVAALALGLSSCAFLSQLGLVPPASGSAHLAAEPEACGQLHDPVRKTDMADPILGAADFHVHQFADLGFGGRLIWGESFNEGGIDAALPVCGVNELCEDSHEAFLCKNVVCRFATDKEACKKACERHVCEQSPPHGRAGLTDPLSAVLRERVGHPVTGYPDFQGWPAYNSFTHQQVYERWLRRAFDGGVKLIVMLAVTNETLCTLWQHDHACDDMTNADLQIDAAYELERFIDYQNDCQNNGNGWYRIARSPQQARQIIADGALAVVLGMEVDTLFNCYADRALTKRTQCTADYVEQQIQKYRDRGVRHLFPIHLMDNGFGGAAVSEDFFNFGNAFVNRELFEVRDCSPEYDFRFGEISGTVHDFLATAAHTLGIPYEPYKKMGAHCNERGLTPIGETAIEKLMDHRMIIDVDHMSARSRCEMFNIAEGRGYQGLVSGHTGFTEVNIKDKKHEGQLTPDEVDRLLKLGGLLAPILNQGNLHEVQAYSRASGTNVPNDCGNSSKAFAQAYLYAVDKAKQYAQPGRVVGVGFGSDFNGLVASPSPRFGSNACNGQRSAAQTGRVDYPIDTYEDIGESMDRSVAGTRTFDINTDGFAHAGMFPDFVADLQSVGLTEDDLHPMFSAAEAYIELWERVERGAQTPVGSTPPARDCENLAPQP